MLLLAVVVLVASYLIGSIPSGLIIVRLKTGKDIRTVESGRTGGTNVARAAGFYAGFATAVLDMLKAMVCAYLARYLAPGNVWLHVLAPALAVIGHNYSIYLIERLENGGFRFRGGAGGAPAFGGGVGLWFPVAFIALPFAAIMLFFVGYASIATLSVPVTITLTFLVCAYLGVLPWQYIFYGLIIFFILAWALRPNIRRLINGNERLVGIRARRRKNNATA